MTHGVVMCADSESQRRPELLGLAGENLCAQSWLTLFSSGERARERLREDRSDCEVWVASSDEVDPINLAAAIKRDRRDRPVHLVSFDTNGSLKSRASSAGIDSVLGRAEFASRYACEKRKWVEAAEPGRARVRECAPPAPSPDRASSARPQTARLAPALPQIDLASGLPAYPGVRSPRDGAGKGGAFVMPVMSGSGGAGKSTVAVLAATIASRMGYKTLLLDLDLQFGDMKPLLGRDEAVGVDDLADDPSQLARLRPPAEGPALVAAPSKIERCEDIARRSPEIIGALRASFDVIVANTGGFWMEQHMALLECADKAVFLIDQRPSSLRACTHALELCSRCAVATSPFVFAVNRCARGALYTSIDVSCALRGSHVVELACGGSEVEEVLATGRPDDLLYGGNALCASIERMLVDVLPDCGDGERRPAVAAPRRLFPRRRARGRAACL